MLGVVNTDFGTYDVFMTSIDRETEKLRAWLEKQSISDMNRRTGIGRTTMYRFIKGDYKPTLTVLSRLAKEREKENNDGSKAA